MRVACCVKACHGFFHHRYPASPASPLPRSSQVAASGMSGTGGATSAQAVPGRAAVEGFIVLEVLVQAKQYYLKEGVT
ncbi:MAG: hypothetical protein CVU38_11215 [Chloroflexi bacterium HGW-Chloroflexi-1]|nr:MAG: hypothetical protein CVU38_11215 [Chloroflexi bacterium HGW-Chloroflexi-1]